VFIITTVYFSYLIRIVAISEVVSNIPHPRRCLDSKWVKVVLVYLRTHWIGNNTDVMHTFCTWCAPCVFDPHRSRAAPKSRSNSVTQAYRHEVRVFVPTVEHDVSLLQ
jgi:hypothetical protein